jgi:hypothetical protein
MSVTGGAGALKSKAGEPHVAISLRAPRIHIAPGALMDSFAALP